MCLCLYILLSENYIIVAKLSRHVVAVKYCGSVDLGTHVQIEVCLMSIGKSQCIVDICTNISFTWVSIWTMYLTNRCLGRSGPWYKRTSFYIKFYLCKGRLGYFEILTLFIKGITEYEGYKLWKSHAIIRQLLGNRNYKLTEIRGETAHVSYPT